MSSDFWNGSVKNTLAFYGLTLVGLWTASMEGGGWASLDR